MASDANTAYKSENKSETATVQGNTATVLNINAKGFKIICKQCAAKSIKKSPSAKFCSDSCKNEWHRQNKPSKQAEIWQS